MIPRAWRLFSRRARNGFQPTRTILLPANWRARIPAEAIEWAGRLPEDRGLSAGADAFSDWRRSQPDAATKWLNALPSSDLRRVPYFQSAVRSLAWDTQSAEQLAALSASERTIARDVIKDMKLPEDRRSRLLEILKSH